MANHEEVKNTEFDHSGQYDSGLKSLVRSLRVAFLCLVVIIVGMVAYFLTFGGYLEVKPQQSVLVLRFGKFLQTYDRGWYWFPPYPVTSLVEVPTSPRTFKLAFMPAGDALSQQGGGQPLEPGRDSYLLTGDANIIHTSWSASYRISDPTAYYLTLATPPDPGAEDTLEQSVEGISGRTGPQSLLKNLLAQAVIQVTSRTRVDDILYGQNKTRYTGEVEQAFVKLLGEANCGVELNTLTLDYAAPPLKTKAAFDEVSAAGNTQSSLISQAKEYQVRTENEMLAQAADILAQAETYRKQVVSVVKAESIYFTSINEQYAKSPRTVLTALYNNVLAEVMSAQDGKYIMGTSTPAAQKQVRIKLNPEPPRPAVKSTAEDK